MKSVNQLLKENETVMRISTEFYEMFHSMEEGLVVFKNDAVSFSNNTFQRIIGNVNFGDGPDSIKMKDYKLFKLYRGDDE